MIGEQHLDDVVRILDLRVYTYFIAKMSYNVPIFETILFLHAYTSLMFFDIENCTIELRQVLKIILNAYHDYTYH